MQSAVPSKCGIEYPACIPGPGVENAGAMKQIRNAELVDSGTQDSYQATHNRCGWFKRVHSCHQFLTNGHNSECQTQIKDTPGEGGQSPSFRRSILH